MQIIVVVEGQSDKRVLERALENIRGHVRFEFYISRGRDAGRPIARQFLMQPRTAVAFVYDADTNDSERALADSKALNDYFAWVSDRRRFLVQPMVPELETVFFESPQILNSTLGINLTTEQLQAAQFAPKKILQSILAVAQVKSLLELVEDIAEPELELLRGHAAIRSIRNFLEEVSITSLAHST